MRFPRKRSILATLAAIGLGAILVLPTGAAAQDVESGSLTMTSDPGDPLGQGRSFAYSTDAGDLFQTGAANAANEVAVSVEAANGDSWSVHLAAPFGQSLAPGTYGGATRYPFQAPDEPGLSVTGNSTGCNTVTGSFTITGIVLGGPGDTLVERLDGTFEQHCEGVEPALRGEFHLANPPAPEPLTLGSAIDPDGTFSRLNGQATVGGTVSCSLPVAVIVTGRVTQVAKRDLITGLFSTSTGVSCTPESPAVWRATANPSGSVPFQGGDVQVEIEAFAFDPNFGGIVTVEETAAVRLKKG
jgi:hypothetical protein